MTDAVERSEQKPSSISLRTSFWLGHLVRVELPGFEKLGEPQSRDLAHAGHAPGIETKQSVRERASIR